jgi:predicted porin
MKKTLIAVAALAATGTTFAQATISGQLGFSWQQSPVVAADGSHVQGLSMNDGEIYISATEDLGGGMSATARGGFTMRGRGTGIADRDGTISLMTPNGSVTVGAVRSCGPLDAVKSGAVTGTVYTANESVNEVPLDKCSLVEVVTYTSPKIGDFTLAATYGEFGSAITAPTSSLKGNTTGLTFTVLGATYTSGAIMATGDVTSYAAATSSSQSSGLKPLDGWLRTRIAGTYNMGAAKFGLGYQTWTWGKADQMLASVAVPAGNMVFGIDYMTRGAQGAATKGTPAENTALDTISAALSGTKNGDPASSAVGVGVTYNFSKTTNLNASYITYTDAGKNVNPTSGVVTKATLDNEYRIRLLKTF